MEKQALEGIVSSFSDKQERQTQDQNQWVDELYQQIGKLKVELNWLKKNPTYSGDWRNLIDRNGPISIHRQCELLGKNRSSLYYKPIETGAGTLLLMKLIDEEYKKHPFYGTHRMRTYLRNQDYWVNNRKQAQRWYRLMGLGAVYSKPKLSKRNLAHKIYPCLLRDIEINRCNQVWSTGISA